MYLINGQLNAELTLDTALERLQAQLPALLDCPPRNEEVLDRLDINPSNRWYH